jgi:hypothetical protein
LHFLSFSLFVLSVFGFNWHLFEKIFYKYDVKCVSYVIKSQFFGLITIYQRF